MPKADADSLPKTFAELNPETIIHVLHVDDDEDFLISSKRMTKK